MHPQRAWIFSDPRLNPDPQGPQLSSRGSHALKCYKRAICRHMLLFIAFINKSVYCNCLPVQFVAVMIQLIIYILNLKLLLRLFFMCVDKSVI